MNTWQQDTIQDTKGKDKCRQTEETLERPATYRRLNRSYGLFQAEFNDDEI